MYISMDWQGLLFQVPPPLNPDMKEANTTTTPRKKIVKKGAGPKFVVRLKTGTAAATLLCW